MCVTKQGKKLLTVVRHSCLTGKIVWIYRGPSQEAARRAYYRACKKEVERVRNWPQYAEHITGNIKKLLSNCLAALPITAELTPEQKSAVKELQAMANEEIPCYMGFYDHIMEEARRRNEASGRWRENRIRLFGKKEMKKKIRL